LGWIDRFMVWLCTDIPVPTVPTVPYLTIYIGTGTYPTDWFSHTGRYGTRYVWTDTVTGQINFRYLHLFMYGTGTGTNGTYGTYIRYICKVFKNFLIRIRLNKCVVLRWCPAPNCTYAVVATGCASCPKAIPSSGHNFIPYRCLERLDLNELPVR